MFVVCVIFIFFVRDQRGCLISEKVLGREGDGVEGWCIIWQYIKGLFYFQTYTPQRQVVFFHAQSQQFSILFFILLNLDAKLREN